jgi:hypothetical protein
MVDRDLQNMVLDRKAKLIIMAKKKKKKPWMGLAQVVRALVFVVVPWGLRFESPLVQTIFWGQPAGEVGVLPDLCGDGVLHESEVYLTWVDIRSDPALKGF